MQLVAYGAQDIYLTGNPQITFFKVVYRRHTNFSMECIKQSFKGAAGANSRVVATLARNGDLVHDCFLKVKGSTAGGAASDYNNPGHNIINNIELEIGGQLIDKHYGHWMEAHAQLTESGPNTGHKDFGNTANYDYGGGGSSGTTSNFQMTAFAGGVVIGNNDLTTNTTLFIPLRFWFCRHVGLSLPLIALQYHDVELKTTFRNLEAMINASTTVSSVTLQDPTISLWGNYIYLDTDERKRFAKGSHEYLIEQVQLIKDTFSSRVSIPFNHSVKSLYWVIQNNTAIKERLDYTNINPINNDSGNGDTWVDSNDYLNYMTHKDSFPDYVGTNTTYEHFEKAKITLNGLDRIPLRSATYFRTIQPYECEHEIPHKHIYMYSFCLKPNEYQPSGGLNFSKIDNAYLEFTGSIDGSNYTISVYAINYNVLRIMSGMGGLLYSS